VETSFVHISGRGICGSSGTSSLDFMKQLKSGVSSIEKISEPVHSSIKTASILDQSNYLNDEFKIFNMLQMALFEALESAGLWSGEPWQPKSPRNLQSKENEFSLNVSGLPRKVGIFLGISPKPKSYNGDKNYRSIYESQLQNLSSKIEENRYIFDENINQSCLAKYIRQLIGKNSEGPNVTIQNTGVSSMQAVGEAYKAIKSGEVDIAIAGGVQEYSLWTGLNLAAQQLYSRAIKVEDSCRPFDLRRQGTVLGEGSGLLILESDLSLERRRKKGFALIRSYAGSNNCHRLTSYPSSGSGLTKAMNRCWQLAGKPKIDIIISNGSGTRNADSSECAAIRACQLEQAWTQSIKSFTGHTMAAAGAYNLIAGLLQQEHKFYTHTLHLKTPDPHCELNHLPLGGVHERLNFLMTNAMGLGGTNSCVILEFR
tara:strand:+ start:6798 stop:8081 length:1284 start_codon:yes stop_codon:yes gene_type:complete